MVVHSDDIVAITHRHDLSFRTDEVEFEVSDCWIDCSTYSIFVDDFEGYHLMGLRVDAFVDVG